VIMVDLERETIEAKSSDTDCEPVTCTFKLDDFDRELVAAGGWLAYADQKY